MNENYFFTSESVTEGHPDKVCDIVSDAILDAYLSKDPQSRVACEVTATTGIITVLGEITSKANIDLTNVVRKTVADIGYSDGTYGFNANDCAVMQAIDAQSPDIDRGVSRLAESRNSNGIADKHDKIGAGDQGMMFGYACTDTPTLMPAPIYYAHHLCKALSRVRKDKILDYIGPDGKSMVTFVYQDGKPVRIDTIVVSTQHLAAIPQKTIQDDLIAHVIKPTIPASLMDGNTNVLVNPTGRFVHGGPCADTGLTGRKIIVDTYGGMGRHGGGAFSGKDPTKVDRTGAYAARYIAKNIIAAGIAEKCEVQIAYAIGVAKPVSVYIETFGTSNYSNSKLSEIVAQIFDLRPASIIEQFQMRRPIYKDFASYGHMGREDLDAPWEKTDKAELIKTYLR